MEGVRAWEMLNDPNYSARLTMDAFRKLLIRAGYSPKVAHKAAMQRGWERLSAGEVL